MAEPSKLTQPYTSLFDCPEVQQFYHDLQRRNTDVNSDMVRRILKQLQPNTAQTYINILDIGCGQSPLLPHLLAQLPDSVSVHYTGIDSSEQMIVSCRQQYPSSGQLTSQFTHMTIDALTRTDAFTAYDVIIVQNVVHLILNRDELHQLCHLIMSRLAVGGVFYISTKLTVDIDDPTPLGNPDDQIYMVRKSAIDSATYPRRVFNRLLFHDLITSKFDPSAFHLTEFYLDDNIGNTFMNLIGCKTI